MSNHLVVSSVEGKMTNALHLHGWPGSADMRDVAEKMSRHWDGHIEFVERRADGVYEVLDSWENE